MTCLERDPSRRWPDARSFRDALGASLDDDPDRLPGELREVSGGAFYSVTVGFVLASAASAAFPSLPVWLQPARARCMSVCGTVVGLA
jgi:hypothetical protein